MNISKLFNLPEGAGLARFPPSEIRALGVGEAYRLKRQEPGVLRGPQDPSWA